MSRNGSGTMSIPNTMTAGTTITAAPHNQNYSDIASELTNSLALDGQSTMAGQLKAAAGTVALPGIAFGSDTDSGIYRIGANNMGVALGGSKVIDIASTGATVTGTVDATTIKQGGFSLIPAGLMSDYAGSTAPDGWLLCDGTEYSQATYAALYSAIGSTYNTGGETSGYFRVPDAKGRVTAGKEASATRLTTAGSGIDGATLGAAGGAQTVTISQANLPSYNLVASGLTVAGTVTSSLQARDYQYQKSTTAGTGGSSGMLTAIDSPVTFDFSGSASGNVPSGGSGTAVNKVQPTLVVNKIIKY